MTQRRTYPISRVLPKGMPRVYENRTGRPFIIQPILKADRIKAFYQRLSEGAGKPCLFLPSTGEFGHRIMTAIRLVHWHQASEKIVCCKDGEQVLYPSAKGFVWGWKDREDATRSGTGDGRSWPDIEALYPNHQPIQVGNWDTDQELECINPTERIPFSPKLRGLKVDVCLGIRYRKYCPEKNWSHWPAIGQALQDAGYTFAVIGTRPLTLDLSNQMYSSSDYDTDAAIELIQNCRLYVGTDTGTSHLAATIGSDMLVWREESQHNRDLRPCMLQRNPNRVESLPSGTWTNPASVIDRMLAKLK